MERSLERPRAWHDHRNRLDAVASANDHEMPAVDEEQAPVLPPWSRLPASRSERPRTLWNTPGNAGSVSVLPGGTCWGHGGAVVAEALWESPQRASFATPGCRTEYVDLQRFQPQTVNRAGVPSSAVARRAAVSIASGSDLQWPRPLVVVSYAPGSARDQIGNPSREKHCEKHRGISAAARALRYFRRSRWIRDLRNHGTLRPGGAPG
jgi:hypothetical protein